MKNNKNGWGFKTFLIFLAIFCFCLLASFYGFRKFGLVDENGATVTYLATSTDANS